MFFFLVRSKEILKYECGLVPRHFKKTATVKAGKFFDFFFLLSTPPQIRGGEDYFCFVLT